MIIEKPEAKPSIGKPRIDELPIRELLANKL